LRPFELVFIEIVPKDERSLLDGRVDLIDYPRHFTQSSRQLELAVSERHVQHAVAVPYEKVYAYQLEQAKKSADLQTKPLDPKRNWQVELNLPAISTGATLVVTCQLQLGKDAYMIVDIGNFFTCEQLIDAKPVSSEPVVRNWSLPCSWQAWRIRVQPAQQEQHVELHVTLMSPADVRYDFNAYLIPDPT
jgi:hypothetical protein